MKISDILVFVLSIPALWLMGKKRKSCFFIFTLVNFLMAYICLTNDPKLWGVLGMQFIYTVFNVRNYILWSKSEADVEVNKFIR